MSFQTHLVHSLIALNDYMVKTGKIGKQEASVKDLPNQITVISVSGIRKQKGTCDLFSISLQVGCVLT